MLGLGQGTKLHFLDPQNAEDIAITKANVHPTITITGLRNPCWQIEKHRQGLQEVFVERDTDRAIIVRKAGVMSTVDVGGIVMPGMRIVVEAPADRIPLKCV